MGDNETTTNMTQVAFWFDKDLLEALDRRAEMNDRSRSGELRAILKDALGVRTAKEG